MTNPDEVTEEVTPESSEETQEDTSAAPTKEELQEVLSITREVRDKLSASEPAKEPNQADLREKIKEQTGMTDSQIDFTLNTATNAAMNAAAPAMAELAIANMYRSKPDFKDFEKDVRDELEKYPIAKRGDSELIEKIYYMAKGKKMSNSPAGASKGNPPANPKGPVSRRIVPESRISDVGLGGDEHETTETTALSVAEKTIAKKMGISEKDYARAKGETVISRLK